MKKLSLSILMLGLVACNTRPHEQPQFTNEVQYNPVSSNYVNADYTEPTPIIRNNVPIRLHDYYVTNNDQVGFVIDAYENELLLKQVTEDSLK